MERSVFALGLVLYATVVLTACGQPTSEELGASDLSGAAHKGSTLVPQPTPSQITLSPLKEYKGVPLPSPEASGDVGPGVQLPAAWLLVGRKAVAGSLGSFTHEGEVPCKGNSQETPPAGSKCIGVVHADTGPPDAAPGADFDAVRIPPTARPVILISSQSVRGFEATLRDWAEEGMPAVDPSWREHPHTRIERHGSLTTYTLKPVGKGRDQVLTITIQLEGANEVTSYWRLDPR